MIAMQTRFFLYIARCFSASDVTSNKVRACGCSLRDLSSLGENFGIAMMFFTKHNEVLAQSI